MRRYSPSNNEVQKRHLYEWGINQNPTETRIHLTLQDQGVHSPDLYMLDIVTSHLV